MCSPSGTWANATLTEATTNAKGCSLCPSGTYRTGDAAPENNACRRIPPGGQKVEAAWVCLLSALAWPSQPALSLWQPVFPPRCHTLCRL